MKVCLACGTIAPLGQKTCSSCESPLEENTTEVAPRDDDVVFARVSGHFSCRSCGEPVPLNHFCLNGIPCSQCGIKQSFKAEDWPELLEHAHNTADLTGPRRPVDGTRDWIALTERIGEETGALVYGIGRSRSRLTISGGSFSGLDYAFSAGPGHPVCQDCKQVLDVEVDEVQVVTTCPACKQQIVYARPDRLDIYPSLAGVLNDEHRDRPGVVAAEEHSGGAAVSIDCPKCGAPLQLPEQGRKVVCPFCATTSLVPIHLSAAGSAGPAPEQSWWMLFRGDSPWRREMRKGAELRVLRTRKRKKENRQEKLRDEAQKRDRRRLALIWIGFAIVFIAVALLLEHLL